MNKINLSSYNNDNFFHGRSILIRFLWIVVSRIFFETVIPFPSYLKSKLLVLFGAKIGKGLVIKPSIKIKQPWFLEIGDHCWIGERVWIDNLVRVKLASNVCLSQGVYLLTGNHNYKKSSFDLMTSEINIEDGVWLGAKCMVGPGVNCYSHSLLTAGSITFKNLDAYCIYEGNPARVKRIREII
jgi:putative colanic acid biosynthesis acetyltransferase WcaF